MPLTFLLFVHRLTRALASGCVRPLSPGPMATAQETEAGSSKRKLTFHCGCHSIHSQQVMGIWGQQVSEATSEKLDRFAGPVQQCESAIMSISLQNAPASRASVVRKTPRRPSFFFSRHAHAKQRTGPNSEWDDGARVLVRFTFRAGQSESLRSASSASSSRWPAATIHCERELNGRRERSCGSEAPLFTVFNSAKGAGAGGGGGGGPRTDSGPGLTTH
ncbi:hypothetical protein MPTK1_4g12410 [Marchantia polymorpha subsp. ruderalis]|uniref:Secreted protein n=2 Tax=Marchantia polymorpha TaxID=3197 RepID=A0AAF6B960_MARPO|nr:hypothetical protein MARPO_0174s0003 [Marchantia polymorpha]BBN08544.1 hypothetical protein Mp_4g12410 [Marchantia polymorpha subsp. ruderalis]|eukprot:PTQ28071.1 hypothetical protein MARPO_0174s0003 [Marchantia polymorpha]